MPESNIKALWLAALDDIKRGDSPEKVWAAYAVERDMLLHGGISAATYRQAQMAGLRLDIGDGSVPVPPARQLTAAPPSAVSWAVRAAAMVAAFQAGRAGMGMLQKTLADLTLISAFRKWKV